MQTGFRKIKLEVLKKLNQDKSSKGSIDKPIVPLVDKINQLPDFVTTSSCSGRISIVKEKEGMTKHRKAWLFKSHSKVCIEDLRGISLIEEKCSLKFESVILHIATKNVDKGLRMLKLAKEAGWKKSGIISVKDNKVVLECSSTEILAMPFSKSNRIIANDEMLEEFCKEANEKLERAHKKIERFLTEIEKNKDFLSED
jgi:tRNA wybutosine-synthesizing protein 3